MNIWEDIGYQVPESMYRGCQHRTMNIELNKTRDLSKMNFKTPAERLARRVICDQIINSVGTDEWAMLNLIDELSEQDHFG